MVVLALVGVLAFGIGGAASAQAQTTQTSSMWISFSGGATATVGDPVTVFGFLTFSDAQSPLGATVHVARTNPDQTQTQLADATVISDQGGFNFTDTPPTRGVYSYTVTYDGTAQRSGTTAASGPLTVYGHYSTLTLTASTHVVAYEASVTLTAHFTGTGVVSIWRTRAGYPRSLVTSAAVDGNGNLVVSANPGRTTTFSATYAGDATNEPAQSGTVTVAAHAKIIGQMLGGYATSGGYRLYHYHASCPATHLDCPHYQASVLPNHSGECVTFTLQELHSGAWRTIGTTGCGRLNSASQARAYLIDNTATIGHAFRWATNTSFATPNVNLATTSAWTYFKITK